MFQTTLTSHATHGVPRHPGTHPEGVQVLAEVEDKSWAPWNHHRAPGPRDPMIRSPNFTIKKEKTGYEYALDMDIMNLYIYIQEPTELCKKKRFNLQATPVYDRKRTNLFFFHNYFFSIILSVTVCPSIRNLNAF
jgi:hypothetical protein